MASFDLVVEFSYDLYHASYCVHREIVWERFQIIINAAVRSNIFISSAYPENRREKRDVFVDCFRVRVLLKTRRIVVIIHDFNLNLGWTVSKAIFGLHCQIDERCGVISHNFCWCCFEYQKHPIVDLLFLRFEVSFVIATADLEFPHSSFISIFCETVF